ncbi:MAG: hypothetical protein KU28_08730 [Sulfurovum sp. PC08-66]|nr:MAG: hypothetical protein KU28_08730 [Sulfurovum sp. PC08-66]
MFGMGKKEPTQEATTHGDHSPITQQIHSGSGDNIEGDKITNNYNHSNPHTIPNIYNAPTNPHH